MKFKAHSWQLGRRTDCYLNQKYEGPNFFSCRSSAENAEKWQARWSADIQPHFGNLDRTPREDEAQFKGNTIRGGHTKYTARRGSKERNPNKINCSLKKNVNEFRLSQECRNFSKS